MKRTSVNVLTRYDHNFFSFFFFTEVYLYHTYHLLVLCVFFAFHSSGTTNASHFRLLAVNKFHIAGNNGPTTEIGRYFFFSSSKFPFQICNSKLLRNDVRHCSALSVHFKFIGQFNVQFSAFFKSSVKSICNFMCKRYL